VSTVPGDPANGPGAQRLLILDDDVAVCELIRHIAEPAGFATRTTLEPADFFREIEAWSPSHVALDLVMPAMDGVQVLAHLAERGCRARIVITSGVGSRVLGAAGRAGTEHGLDIAGVLAKPFSPAALRDLLSAKPAAGGASPGAARSSPAPAGGFEVDERNLGQAIARRELVVVYQPKIRCADRALAGFEALVRWMHPEWGVIPPDRFIPFAERHGVIDAITESVLDQSLGWLAGAFPSGAGLAPSLAVNISARSLGDMDLIERISARCRSHGIEHARLTFELTESSAMQDPVKSLDLLTRLRVRGFALSIDDFGTGFSSMVQLARLPFSEIKVDKSFVMESQTSAESRAVVRSIVDLGHSLGLTTTAEGVESEAILTYLRSIGCDLAQGYHIARPMTAEAVQRWLPARMAS
jgi:EAL domain-containing protein (putative c-di-GMP-specific phosphodiesterase class I)